MNDDYDDNGTELEIQKLIGELQNDAERLNITADKSDAPDDLKHMIAALADKIDGLASLVR
ncbi:hypothetical protein HKD24_14465 [Gluconobacter sp. LMG 31484]|uniref:Uncharacterized protein n=1 Tax=Gluconobacter vitians TaxID=2728102 RepID=A0ABR9Y9C5_9PROT|nr:hypothetical protein [Gluconobacter vitians]MBF0860386.1 hypothetical protein [Gluconobacter vitians]